MRAAFHFFNEVGVTVSHRFKHFEVRPDGRLLLIDGKPAVVGSRAFDLLLMLIEHRDRVVTKRELLAQLWPRMVVEENNLQIHVSTLRKLVGVAAIVTVQGRGYRFVLEPLPAESPVVSVLPAVPPSLSGRDSELRQLAQVLQECRLVTVVGPGGIGKTSVALAAARAYGTAHSAGTYWVDLARLPTGADEALVAAAIAHAVALPVPADGVLAVLTEALRERSGLLVLDNAEHVLAGVAGCVHALMGGVPRLRLLVTSQAPLYLSDELLFRLDGLAVAPAGVPIEEAMDYGAVALFVERARAVDRHFTLTDANLQTVIAICRQLDGLPLALRLAASRLTVLGLEGVALRLRDSLNLLCASERNVMDRQQTMQAALHWSFGLLPPRAQQLFCRLGVFVGGFRLEAAEAMAADLGDGWRVLEQLQELVERSMLQLETAVTGQVRYHIPECARQYAWQRLQEQDGLTGWQREHASACLRLMEQAYDSYWRSDDDSWLRCYAPDLDNVRCALDWATQAEPVLALRLVGAAGPLFMLVGMAPEARNRSAAAARAAGVEDDTDADAAGWRARFWLERSRLEWGISSGNMLFYATRALALYRRQEDRLGTYLALRCAAAASAAAGEDVTSMLDEMTALELPGWGARAQAQRLLTQAAVCKANGDMALERSALDRLQALGRQAGLDAVVCAALGGLAEWCLVRQDYEAAIEQAALLLARRDTHRGNFLLLAHGVQAGAHYLRGDSASGKASLSEFARAARPRNWEWLGMYGETLALCAALDGRIEDAARLIGFANASRSRIGPRDGAATETLRRACAICADLLAEADLGRLREQGASIDAEFACRLALGDGGDGRVAVGPGPRAG
jgi:predicted ATPase